MKQIPKHRGFLHHERKNLHQREVSERIGDFREVSILRSNEEMRTQAARCMDCGVPFCQSGCPVGNVIPDWNDLVLKNEWEKAYRILSKTNNFPEFTGRICPAPCESACVLSLYDQAVSIENIERAIVETAFERDYVTAKVVGNRTGKKIAIVGSGPAGLAAADQLNRAGHWVEVYERHQELGGLLRYGIPDFKLEKWVIDRRISLLEKEGIKFRAGIEVGIDLSKEDLDRDYDVVVFCCGATQARDLSVPGRGLKGIHFAWDFLSKQNQLNSGEIGQIEDEYSANSKDVIVIGGGDTGSDCIGTSIRQKAKSVTQFEVLPAPNSERSKEQPWPYYPMLMKVSSSHEEGGLRNWSVMTKRFLGKHKKLVGLETVQVKVEPGIGFQELPNTTRTWSADMVLLAIGYSGPEKSVFENLEIEEPEGKRSDFSDQKLPSSSYYYAGDMRRGQSLVVWAIREGREVAQKVDTYLMGRQHVEGIGIEDLPRI